MSEHTKLLEHWFRQLNTNHSVRTPTKQLAYPYGQRRDVAANQQALKAD